MRNRGITFKLFILTVIFFASFYILVLLSQVLFFNRFYQDYKVKKVERDLYKFAQQYSHQNRDKNKELAVSVAKFMNRNRTQLAIVDFEGNLVLGDPYRMTVELPNHNKITVPLSLFLNVNDEELRKANIQQGDPITIWGEEYSRGNLDPIVYPEKILVRHSLSIGETSPDSLSVFSGVVEDIIAPTLKTQRQGLLYVALNELFPLSDEMKKELNGMEEKELQWVEPWSGTNNIIIMQPLVVSGGNKQILFSVTSLQEINDANEALRWFYIYLSGGGFIFILILALYYSKMVTSPIVSLNEAAQKMVDFDFSSFKPLQQSDELGSLSQNMYTMAQKLDKALGELQDANQQLQNDMEQKERIEMTQKSFFTNASHELKTPISIIKSFAEGLQDGINIDKQEHYISVIIEETERMEMLIKDMLDLARLESGTIQLRKRSILLSELIDKSANRLLYQLKAKGLEIIVIPVNELPVLIDPDWFEQVIVNLTTNAIKHADHGSDILFEIHSDRQSSTLYVKNKGKTIPEPQINLIWERFYRGEASRSRQTGGTGLGLSIVQQILDLHHCEYSVTNLDDGVQFMVKINH
ncbi:histidine kinase [Paenibacillus stellifer]|uniref:histidine kinase n=1 Tax=Paenibacillus stellifer TaxID=169760 RepID=A0A089LRB6_9BACL|nr:HAMP domain-containing sensor histidine kinase [Paenibacillus stellifer]AIQ64096.1 histidine kinase [Paenibacillus stellifer]